MAAVYKKTGASITTRP